MQVNILLEKLYQKLLSKKTKEKSEQVILWIALVSFIIHLLMIGLIHFNVIAINEPSNLLINPIAAIYTPFSFILVYEVYLLIYYLPKSTATIAVTAPKSLSLTRSTLSSFVLTWIIATVVSRKEPLRTTCRWGPNAPITT